MGVTFKSLFTEWGRGAGCGKIIIFGKIMWYVDRTIRSNWRSLMASSFVWRTDSGVFAHSFPVSLASTVLSCRWPTFWCPGFVVDIAGFLEARAAV